MHWCLPPTPSSVSRVILCVCVYVCVCMYRVQLRQHVSSSQWTRQYVTHVVRCLTPQEGRVWVAQGEGDQQDVAGAAACGDDRLTNTPVMAVRLHDIIMHFADRVCLLRLGVLWLL